MASPRRLPAAGSGNKENISGGGGGTVSDFPAPCKEGTSSPRTRKKPAGFNLRKSIAWNPAFFTEQGVLDNSELSLLAGSQLKANRSPSSGASGTVSPFCRSGRSATPCVLKEVTENPRGKLPAKYHSAEKQGRKLFSSAKTPQRGQQRESMVPAITAILEEASGSVKRKNFLPHPQISPSSSFGGPASTFAKPSALRMPSPSVGFFTQENAHVPHGNVTKTNVGRCFVGNTSSILKPPRYRQAEDLKSRLDLAKPLSTNCTAASNLVLSVIRDSNPNTLVASEKEPSSKFITTHLAKSGNANNQERPDVNCLLAGNGTTIQPPNPAKNDAARNSMPVVYSDTSQVERRGISKEIEPLNSYPLKAVCPSTMEHVEDSSLQSTCPLTKPIVGGTSSPSSISSRVCSSSELTCQSKSESGSIEAIYLGNSYVGETTLAISLSEGESCTPGLDFSGGFDSHDRQNTECATLMELVESTVCADQVPCCGSSKGETRALADCNSDFGDSLCNEAKPASSEPNADSGMEIETNNASAVKETPLLHVGCEHNHNYRSTEPSPMKLEAPTPCVERQHALSVEPSMEDKMVLETDKLSALEGASQIENVKVDRSRTNTILKDHMKNLVPFSEEWLAVMEARGQEVLEQKTGAVQNSPPDKAAPEPSPWSPVKRKAQDVGPFDCTKYSKSVRTSGTP
ncbi:hypothetical protein BAE44_0002300 [Dichanthelium oligosanthes]|uniref:Uncharacterized protein n=1 Tax=Dichanthelium oligosanthes TaxID=888268 RepID=A0A1E5WHQ2_9POAL|nr:hypothetical protein BAE44_0002300 [Dichanthelium oligosanthes]